MSLPIFSYYTIHVRLMASAQTHLFSPLVTGGVTIPNRAWEAPMCQYMSKDGVPNDWHHVHLSGFANGGFGLIARIAVLATIGYTAFLVGPPPLGFIGEHIGLRLTMLVVLTLLALPLLLAPTLQRHKA